jgi:hypothetical protein
MSFRVTRPWQIAAVLGLTVCASYVIAAQAADTGSRTTAPRARLVVAAPPLRDVAALPAVRVARAHRHAERAPRRRPHDPRRHRPGRVIPAPVMRAQATPAATAPAPRPVATAPAPRPVATVVQAPRPRPAPTAAPRFDSSGGFDTSG